MCSVFSLNSPLRPARPPAVVRPVSAIGAKDLTVPGCGNTEHAPEVLADAFNRPQSRYRIFGYRIFVPARTGPSGALRVAEAGTTTCGRVWRPFKPGPIRVIWRESTGASRSARNKVIAPAAFVRIAHAYEHRRATSEMREMQQGQA